MNGIVMLAAGLGMFLLFFKVVLFGARYPLSDRTMNRAMIYVSMCTVWLIVAGFLTAVGWSQL